MGDKRDCSNYRGISILPFVYKSLSNTLLSMFTPYVAENTGNQQCGFRCNRSTTAFSDMFPNMNDLKHGDALSTLFFNFALEYDIRRVQVN